MILWCDGGHGAAENMRRDAALLDHLERSGGEPVMRLFRFEPHGITLGHSQDPLRELDTDRCGAAGVEWAVRPTGGRVIFHAEEWTYSFAGRIDDPRWGGSLRESYAAVGDLLVKSLVRLGIPAVIAGEKGMDPAPAGTRTRAKGGAAAPCFASTGRHEIVLSGRKLVGSAQRRLRRAFLQQGSLLLGPGHLRLADFVAAPDAEREQVRAGLERRSASAGRWVGGAPIERWAESLVAILGAGAGVRRIDGVEALDPLTLARSAPYTRSSPVSRPAPDRSRT
jgi:lipoate-protein ligase A